ncbi:unnamed protein product, partial [Medioppia subpectinata]
VAKNKLPVSWNQGLRIGGKSDSVDELSDNLYNHIDMITDDERRFPKNMIIRGRLTLMHRDSGEHRISLSIPTFRVLEASNEYCCNNTLKCIIITFHCRFKFSAEFYIDSIYKTNMSPREFNGCPMSSGKLKNVGKFDANFFTVNDWEADYMDAQIRAALETAYEAIVDSGTVPESLSGTNTGVFIGICWEEQLLAYRDYIQLPSYKNLVSQKVANKFNLKGPTFSADSACSSSFVALNEAYLAIKYGRCDAALCIGVNILFNPNIQYRFFKFNMISPDSKCMCMDERANGYAKGEAVVTVLVQRRSRAKRVYATIVNIVSNNDGYKVEGITYPSWHRQSTVIAKTYAQCNVNLAEVDYVEAHCTGTKAGDPVEIKAIYHAMAFTNKREKPLLIGALKSNIGHTEAASGLCAVTKVILAFENELIPANLHFNKANPAIESLIEGHIQPINENTVFSGDLVGLNNFGFGGSNTHLILRSPKIKAQVDNDQIIDRYQRLVQMCGRSQGAVEYFFDKLFARPSKINKDLLHLINELSKSSPYETGTGCRPMRYRGFTLISVNSSVHPGLSSTPIQINKVAKTSRQLCFLFSGIGSQFLTIDKQLMNFDVISDSIHKSAIVLRDKGVDLLTKPNVDSNNWVLHTILSAVAIQMALTDQLRHLDLETDRIVGYSFGEIVCAYADGCLTAQETLLVAYYCGKLINEMAIKKGLYNKFNQPNTDYIGHSLNQYCNEVLTIGMGKNFDIEILVQTLDSVIGFDQMDDNCDSLLLTVGGPVSTGTRMLSPFIQWDHTKSYREIKFPDYFNFFKNRSDESYTIDFMDVNNQYILDHCIDGKIIFPGTGYLMLAWRLLALHKKISFKEFPVEFRNVQLLRVTPVTADRKVTFAVNLDRSTGRFHIIESGSIVVSGTVREITSDKPLQYMSVLNEIQSIADTSNETPICLQRKDVYKMLRIRGYNYGPSFCCITDAHKIQDTYLSAGIEWRKNWVTFCDCLLQTCNLITQSKQLLVPVAIEELRCDPKQLFSTTGFERRTVIDPHLNIVVTAGLEIRGVRVSPLHRNVKSQKPTHMSYKFFAFDEYFKSGLDNNMTCSSYDEPNFLRSQFTIFTENRSEFSGNRVNILEIFFKFTNDYSHWLNRFQRDFSGIGDKPVDQNIWLVANGSAEGLLGFMKCIQKEPNGHRVRCLQIMDTNNDTRKPVVLDKTNAVLHDGKVGHYVLNELPGERKTVDSKHCFLNLQNRGDLSSFQWFECQHKYWPLNQKIGEKLVHIYYSALNFKDIMLATGRLQLKAPDGENECLIGSEFAGRDENMNRVMGMILSKALATTCLVKDIHFLWPIPDYWSMEEAATVPCVFGTAYYALIIRGKLRSNETVLIHSGSGGVGQAAIRICLSLNCRLLITVGSDAKRKFLQELFPTLGDEQRILELINEGIGSGVVQPLNRTIYDHNRCEEAFRFMASGRHVGKVIVKIRDEELFKQILHFNAIKMPAIPRTTYIITGGLGGMGLEIIDWMVNRGAQRFVVTSRSGPKQPYQYLQLKYFKDTGIEIVVWTQPLGSENDTKDLFVEAMKLGPIGGIFHLSLIISDGLLENQSIDSFNKVFESKSKPLEHLDQLSRQMCPVLDHFVVFSSAVTWLGSAGQSNYGFTNAVMERLCEQREREGLPALAIQWGLVGDVGYVADNITTDDYTIGVTRSQRMYSCLQTLDQLLESDVTICTSVVISDKITRISDLLANCKDLLAAVSRILGHKDLEKFDAKTSLSELGMDSLLSVETKQVIERDFGLVLSTQEIQNLTIERIRQIGSQTKAAVTRRSTDTDHNITDTSVVLVDNRVFHIPIERVVYLNAIKEGRKVFYLPPTDGTYHLFIPVATRMTRPVIGLNWTEECLYFGSIADTAQHFINVIHSEFVNQLDDGFDLCGYSYGVFVAYDMCLALQRAAISGLVLPLPPPKLIALDMCPVQTRKDVVVSLADTQHIFNGDEKLGLLASFLMDKISIQSQELIETVTGVERSQWDRVVAELLIQRIGDPCLALNEVMFAVKSHVHKMQHMIHYSIGGHDMDGHRLKGDVLLIRADQHIVGNVAAKSEFRHTVQHDYGFGEIISGKCIVYKLDGNHTKFMANCPYQISKYIADYLKSDNH